ncbi:MAG: NAD(P)H-binding protein [Actinomycetota bacterium]|nr:NAD(P)H-binding protein [Actinomycetota bacterium]
MKILVAGATGTVGQHVVTQALARGHTVTAVARHPERLTTTNKNLTTVAADILDPAAIGPLLNGVDAVISTVGIGASKAPTTLYSRGTGNLLRGMSQHHVERIVVISSQVADSWAHQPFFALFTVLPLLQHFLGATYDDMRRMERVLWESQAQFTGIWAPRIRDHSATGKYRLGENQPPPRGMTITAPDMATALLDVAERSDLGRQYVFVAN